MQVCKRSLLLKARFGVASSTGAAANADSTPSGRLVIADSVDAAAVTVTGNATGDYTASVTIPSGATIGAQVELQAAATVGGVAGPYQTIWMGRVVPAMVYDALVDGTDKLEIDVQQWLGSVPGAYVAPDNSGIAAAAGAAASAATSASSVDGKLTSGRAANLDNLDATVSSRSTLAAGDAMTLTAPAQAALVAAIEAEIANDATGAAIKQAIVDKLIENLPSIDDLTLSAIAQAVWTSLVSGLTTPDSIGKLIADRLDAQVSSRLAAADYTAPDNSGIASASADAALARAAVYDSASVEGDVITLSNGATQTVTEAGRITVEP